MHQALNPMPYFGEPRNLDQAHVQGLSVTNPEWNETPQ